MANSTVTISIRRPGGIDITATGQIDDLMVVDICSTLGALLFDASTALPADPGLDSTTA